MSSSNGKGKGNQVDQGLAKQVADLQAMVASMQASNQALQAQLTGGQGSRSNLSWQGHSSSSLIRAMAGVGWGGRAINQVLVALGLVVSPATVQTQRALAKGSPGTRTGKPVPPKPGANLTPAQWAHLQACLGAAAPPAFTPTGLLPQGPTPAPLVLTPAPADPVPADPVLDQAS